MPEPTGALQALRASTADLVHALENDGWSDADLAAPTLCPGWSRGHVLSHLARNADGIAATLAGALRGEVVARYPGGDPQRDADIDAGAGRPFAVVLADVRDSAAKLDRVLAAVHDAEAWDSVTDQGVEAHAWVLRRLREVELHRVDLDAGYPPSRWPAPLIDALLPAAAPPDGTWRLTVTDGSVVPELMGRTWTAGEGEPVDVSGPDWALLAWLEGRAERPGG